MKSGSVRSAASVCNLIAVCCRGFRFHLQMKNIEQKVTKAAKGRVKHSSLKAIGAAG